MDDGWIKLHRSALDCEQFKDDWLWRLWCWCMLKAKFSPRKVGSTVVPRGSFITGKLRAAEELGVHPSRWFRGIHTLAEPPYSCIHILANRERTMITVINFDTYQDGPSETEPPANHQRTTSEPPANPIEERKNVRTNGLGGGVHVPTVYDTPAISAAMDRFGEFFRHKFPGEHFDAFMREETYQHAMREAWTVEQFLVNVSESIKAGWRGIHAKLEPQVRTGVAKPARTFTKGKYDQ